jgi:hypothetical protein
MSQTLAQRLTEPDMVGLPDWQAADELNKPDSTLPIIASWETTTIGPGTLMATLGPSDAATLLNGIEAAGATDPVMKWGLRVIEMGVFDVAQQASRDQLEAMVTAGAITAAQRDLLFALSKRERYPSWAEYNDTFVDARAVGIARGGVA